MVRWPRVLAATALAPVAALAMLAAAPPAGASDSATAPLRASGTVTVTWAGDPARGCAEAGVCGIRGSTTWRPGSGGQLDLFGLTRGARRGHGILLLGYTGEGPVARVERRGGDGSLLGSCVDPAGDEAGFLGAPVRRGRLRIALRTATLPFSGGRCAGPRPSDVAPALPAADVSMRRLLRRATTVDLTGRRPFAAGAFSGEVVSTLRLRVARASRRDSQSDPGVDEDRGRPQAALILSYRVDAVAGTVGLAFRGLPQPGCAPLDACGGEGSADFVPRAGSRLDIYSTRALRGRTTRRRELRALRTGRTDAGGFNALGGTVTGTARWPGATTCADSARARGVPLLLDVPRRGAPTLELLPAGLGYVESGGGGGGGDILRTRCPGPGAEDALSRRGTLARARLARSALGARRLRVTLVPGARAFEAPGWSGEARGALTLDLRLVRISLLRDSRIARRAGARRSAAR